MDLANFGPSSAFQMYQIPYTVIWTNANNSDCSMIPPVAEFGSEVNKNILIQVTVTVIMYIKTIRPGVGS